MTVRRHNEPMPCGTRAAYKRGCRCEPCTTALREYDAAYRQRVNATKPPKPHNTTRSHISMTELVQEIRFLINAGEGEHRILTATGYLGRERQLKGRLNKAGHHNLTQAIFNQWDLAA